jgi:putative membrane protein
MTIAQLPHVLAVINLATVLALGIGLYFIRSQDELSHRASMAAATVLGVAFLAIYVIYHLNAGLAKFGGHGVVRPIYFTLLIIHILAAVATVPMVPVTIFRGLGGRREAHRRIAKWTWSVWMFVSVSGLVVYAMAVLLYPYSGS